ncbi:DUF4367 domain-containing protein [bacterium 210917-SL.2.15]|nr:DUF4367 domain-containing protein [bacterium 210917-SL.2.15]
MSGQQIMLSQAIGRMLGELCEEELNAVPPRAELRRICGNLSGLDRRIRSALRGQRAERERRAFCPRHVSWRMAKRGALLAAVLMALFLGLLTVSADMRAFLKRTIAVWTGPNVDIRYEVDGHKLTELPEGYAPHYIPEGFVYVETDSYEDGGSFQKVYENADGSFIMVTVRIAENASLTSMDTEHTNFEKIDYGEGDAYLGTFEDGDGYAMFWFADGIEHELYISAALKEDEVFKIADGIYS